MVVWDTTTGAFQIEITPHSDVELLSQIRENAAHAGVSVADYLKAYIRMAVAYDHKVRSALSPGMGAITIHG